MVLDLSGDEEIPVRKTRYAEDGIQAIENFQTGHMLSADDLNELVAAIKELDRRLRALE